MSVAAGPLLIALSASGLGYNGPSFASDAGGIAMETPDEALIDEKKREMGWQVYGTNGMGMSCRRWCGRTGASIGSKTIGRG